MTKVDGQGTVRKLVVGCCLLLAGFVPFAFGADAASNTRFVNDKISLEAQVLPTDPFHPAYKADGRPEPLQIRRGDVVKVVITGTLANGFHTYPVALKGPNQASYFSKFTIAKSDGFVPLSPVFESQPELVDGVYEYSHQFSWSQEEIGRAHV